MGFLILAINPGSTSTKLALYKNEKQIYKESIDHSDKELEQFGGILQQIPMRKRCVLDSLDKHGYKPEELSAVIGRGGLLPPVETGGYKVNQVMLDLIMQEKISPHASNLGAVLADEVAGLAGTEAYIYDAVSANEFPPIAKVTGFTEISRTGFCHVLNSRAAAIHYAQSLGKRYDELSLLVAHLGGGISISAHQRGKIIDSIADDNGPFSPERAGSAPLLDIIEMCYSGQYTKNDMIHRMRGGGGLKALLGTSDLREIQQMMSDGNEQARFMLEVQAYQVAKGIGQLLPVFKTGCNAVLLTGGGSYCSYLVEQITSYLESLTPIVVMPGEFEMEALAMGGLRILRGLETVREM